MLDDEEAKAEDGAERCWPMVDMFVVAIVVVKDVEKWRNECDCEETGCDMQSTIITTDQPQETISRPALTQREKHTLNECMGRNDSSFNWKLWMERVSKTSNYAV